VVVYWCCWLATNPPGADAVIHNDDDSIAVKPSPRGQVGIDGTRYDCTQNMLFENLELVGFGASIGSVPPTVDRKCGERARAKRESLVTKECETNSRASLKLTVDSITMRNITMPYSGKGIYVKSNGNDCLEKKTSVLSNL
jgi:hypothetical protein